MDNYEYLYQFCTTQRQREYVDEYVKAGGNISEAGRSMGIDRRTIGRAIKGLKESAYEAGYQGLEKEPSILFFDVETSPIAGYVWNLFQQGIIGGHKHIQSNTTMMSYAAKWRGSEDVEFESIQNQTEEEMLHKLWRLLDAADWTVTHNGDNFDLKLLNGRMVEYGMPPYSPVKSIDTLKMVKRKFRFTSNRLDAIGRQLLGEHKAETGGFELWLECLAGDPEAWAKMETYNIQDVNLLQRVYARIASWDHLHPNYSLYSSRDGKARCTVCGSDNVSVIGTSKTGVAEYDLYRCGDCGHHSRGRQTILTPQESRAILTNAR